MFSADFIAVAGVGLRVLCSGVDNCRCLIVAGLKKNWVHFKNLM